MSLTPIRKMISIVILVAASCATAQAVGLPDRATPVPQTTSGVPHIQIGVEAVPEISAELLQRVSAIPGIKIRPTIVSLPGAEGFWIDETIALAHPEVIVRGREFAHLHPDGSLHASLPPELARQAVKSGWAVAHPWADQRPGWDGFVMIFTPTTQSELEVVFGLISQSYEFITGRSSKIE